MTQVPESEWHQCLTNHIEHMRPFQIFAYVFSSPALRTECCRNVGKVTRFQEMTQVPESKCHQCLTNHIEHMRPFQMRVGICHTWNCLLAQFK
jgi:hypothetical protein